MLGKLPVPSQAVEQMYKQHAPAGDARQTGLCITSFWPGVRWIAEGRGCREDGRRVTGMLTRVTGMLTQSGMYFRAPWWTSAEQQPLLRRFCHSGTCP